MTLPKIVIISALVIGSSLAVLASIRVNQPTAIREMLNGKPIHLELAILPAQQYQGLSDRRNLCQECGMLFPFPKTEPTVFVMRRMNFPLDIVWIKNNEVVGVSERLTPEHTPPYTPYPSPGAVDMVLELNAGMANYYNLQIGEKVILMQLATNS